ncbi:leucine-rich repeat protein lrrA-like [Saccostrea echinata]|uniref:leucine-rich repeat protein lrrA-like n=1 Tax=Saccostrea echinata TaxID=191078 RepID=UPI002A80C00B|nr:leucine-rich repeat protein lrrA-like [Saccostrea echinata]
MVFLYGELIEMVYLYSQKGECLTDYAETNRLSSHRTLIQENKTGEDSDTPCFKLLQSLKRKETVSAAPSSQSLIRRVKDRFKETIITVKGTTLDLGQLSISEIEKLCHECPDANLVQKISLHQTNLTYISGSLGKFRNLVHLDFSNNRVKFISCQLAELTNLKILDLSNNEIEDIPLTVFLIASLRILNLEQNQIRYLPTELLELENLEVLKLSKNPILSPPQEVCILGLDAIFGALLDQKAKTDLLHNWKPYYSAHQVKLMPLFKLCVESILCHRLDFTSMDTIPTSIKKYLTLAKSSSESRLPPLQKCGRCFAYFSQKHLFLNHECKPKQGKQ